MSSMSQMDAAHELQLRVGNYLVVLPANELPITSSSIIEVLKNENCDFSAWLDVARAYLCSGRKAQHEEVLRELMVAADSGAGHASSREPGSSNSSSRKFCLIQSHCAIAQHLAQKARGIDDGNRRAEVKNEALLHRRMADALDVGKAEQLVPLLSGLLALADKSPNFSQAEKEFKSAKGRLCNGKKCVAPQVALGQVYFLQERYTEARKEFASAMQPLALHDAKSPAANELRVALAATWIKEGEWASARMALHRALELDGRCAAAHAGLAAVHLLFPGRSEVSEGISHLREAHRLDPFSAPVSTALASANLLTGDIESAAEFAANAVKASVSPQQRAASLLVQARCMHALQQMGKAIALYQESLAVEPMPLSCYCAGQIVAAMGESMNAMTLLETTLQTVHADARSLSLFAQVFSRAKDRPYGPGAQRQLKLLQDGVKQHCNSATLQEQLGDTLAKVDPQASLEAYVASLCLRGEWAPDAQAMPESKEARSAPGSGATTPATSRPASAAGSERAWAGLRGSCADGTVSEPSARAAPMSSADAGPASVQLLNNAAVVLFRLSRFDDAVKLCMQAQDLIVPGQSTHVPLAAHSAVRYNLARCEEARGNTSVAAETYEALLRGRPEQHSDAPDACAGSAQRGNEVRALLAQLQADCHIRLARMDALRGDHKAAEARFARCIAACTPSTEAETDVLAARSLMYMRLEQFGKARDDIKLLLTRSKGDYAQSYAETLNGNLHLLAYNRTEAADTKQENRDAKLQSAAVHFLKALDKNCGNAFAANGLGAALAYLGRLHEAHLIFQQLQEASNPASGIIALPDVWTNLASTKLALVADTAGADHAVRLYKQVLRQAKTPNTQLLLWTARALFDARDFPAARRVLLRAVHICPHDHALLFNSGLVMQDNARQMAKSATSAAELQTALLEFSQAKVFFERLQTLPGAVLHRRRIKRENIKSHMELCDELVPGVRERLKAAQERELEERDKEKAWRQYNQLNEEKRRMEEAMKARLEEEKWHAQQEAARRTQEEVRARNEAWRQHDAMRREEMATRKVKKQRAERLGDEAPELDTADQIALEIERQAAEAGAGLESSDGEYSAEEAALDEAVAAASDEDAREAGYDSHDERGTADLEHAGRHTIVRKRKQPDGKSEDSIRARPERTEDPGESERIEAHAVLEDDPMEWERESAGGSGRTEPVQQAVLDDDDS